MNPLRNFPSINELLESPTLRRLVDRISRNTLVATVRNVLDEVRSEVQNAASARTLPSAAELAERIARRAMETQRAKLQPVINATGVLLSRCLGRAPLADAALAEMTAVARDYASLELDLTSGQPSRRVEAVEDLLVELTGAEAAMVVNNSAGATLLALAALAAGREVIVSRGQLIELGDGCRLLDVMAASGAVPREVGTANVTRLADYESALSPRSAALMLVYAGGSTAPGVAAGTGLAELAALGRDHHLPVIHVIGMGTLIDLEPMGVGDVPMAGESLKAGADLALLSGDKLLGGPQCGILIGRRPLVELMEKHPLSRALRVGKLTLAALSATLRLYRDPDKARQEIPLLRLLGTSVENLKNRALRLAPQIAASGAVGAAEAMASTTFLGGFLDPAHRLDTWCVAVRPRGLSVDRLAALLRTGSPAVVGRVQDDRLLLDLRSVSPRQDQDLVLAVCGLDHSNPAEPHLPPEEDQGAGESPTTSPPA
jgi:L-seryl-tRNA(Ser) seleniumtransferase